MPSISLQALRLSPVNSLFIVVIALAPASPRVAAAWALPLPPTLSVTAAPARHSFRAFPSTSALIARAVAIGSFPRYFAIRIATSSDSPRFPWSAAFIAVGDVLMTSARRRCPPALSMPSLTSSSTLIHETPV